MTSQTTKQRKLLQIPDGAQEPFSLETIVEPAEIGRLAWWFLQVFPTNDGGIGDLYIDAVINPEAPAWAADWGVRIVKNMFYQRIYYGPEDGPKWCITPNPIYDIRIGALGGLSLGSVTSLRDIRRATREPWQRTIYDDPPATVYAKHRELVARTVRYAREAAEEMLRHAYADAQPEHVQELDAYLSVAYAHTRPIQAIVEACTASAPPAPAQLQETFLRITEPLVAGDADAKGDHSGNLITDSATAAMPAYLVELPLFATSMADK